MRSPVRLLLRQDTESESAMFGVKCFLFAALLALALPVLVRANPTETAALRKAAERGDASAQFKLGMR